MELFITFCSGFLIGMMVQGAIQIYRQSKRRAKIIDMAKWKEEHNRK